MSVETDNGPCSPVQSRAEATRQRLLAAAVDVFAEAGYPGTGLADIAGRAYQTTGAVYYHFSSKEGLALAVIDHGRQRLMAEVRRCLAETSPSLENVIVMTFQVFGLTQRDKSLFVANHLNQAFGHLWEDGRHLFRVHMAEFIEEVAAALDNTELCGGLDAEQVANLVWMALQGSYQLAGIPMGDAADVERLAVSWRVLLRSIVKPESFAYFEEFVNRTASQISPPSSN